MKHSIKYYFFLIVCAVALTAGFASCNKYLDVVPDDGIATEDMVFDMRASAIKWLYSCYSYMTQEGNYDGDPALLGGDELWTNEWIQPYDWTPYLFYIALGRQSASNPINYDWASFYQGIRYCNTLIKRAPEVPDLKRQELEQWIAEAKVLKAYYHFCLIRKWGPIPIIRESLPISAGVDEVKVWREPIDDCFDYVFELLDEAIPYLPERNRTRDEWGRINRPIAAALKAKVAVTAASPLFNGNKDQQTLIDSRGVRLFPDKTDEQIKARWEYAVKACEEAITICHDASHTLYYYQGNLRVDDVIMKELDIRDAICDDWNDEQIWVNTKTYGSCGHNQFITTPNLDPVNYPDLYIRGDYVNVPLKIADQFYTKHGIPVANDKERADINPLDLREVTSEYKWNMKEGATTVEFNFDREPRFYADLGFKYGLWFGPTQNNVTPSQIYAPNCGGSTGFHVKKIIPHEFRVTSRNGYSTKSYEWCMFRLADLYLLYAEAINEAEGPDGEHSGDLYRYLDAVRERAGIPDVKTAWDTYSNAPGYYKTQIGMRDIIHRERLIELAFEGHRFWDLRRWKTAPAEYAKGIYGWAQKSGGLQNYYRMVEVYKQPTFTQKDYFWPLATSDIDQNMHLVQNLGW